MIDPRRVIIPNRRRRVVERGDEVGANVPHLARVLLQSSQDVVDVRIVELKVSQSTKYTPSHPNFILS